MDFNHTLLFHSQMSLQTEPQKACPFPACQNKRLLSKGEHRHGSAATTCPHFCSGCTHGEKLQHKKSLPWVRGRVDEQEFFSQEILVRNNTLSGFYKKKYFLAEKGNVFPLAAQKRNSSMFSSVTVHISYENRSVLYNYLMN